MLYQQSQALIPHYVPAWKEQESPRYSLDSEAVAWNLKHQKVRLPGPQLNFSNLPFVVKSCAQPLAILTNESAVEKTAVVLLIPQAETKG